MATKIEPCRVFISHDGGPYTRTDMPGVLYMTGKSNSFITVGNNSTSKQGFPNWKVYLSKGQACSNPYKVVRHKWQPMRVSAQTDGFVNPPGSVPRHSANGSANFSVSLSIASMGMAPTDATTADIALKRLKSRLASQTNHFNALVPLAETRELRGLIRNSASLTESLVKNLLEIRKTRGRSALKYASNAWLNFSFGISPLISDTKSVCESISTFMDRQNHSVRVYGSASKEWKTSWKGGGTSAYGCTFEQNADIQHKLEYKYIAGVALKVESANNYGVNQQFGLEFQELIPAAWELVPYSWVLDYFGTVGDYLEDTFTSEAGTAKYVVLDRKYTVSAQTFGSHRAGQYFSVRGNVRPGKFEYFEFERSTSANIPHRALRFKTSDEIGANGVNRLLNLASLLVR